jgi:hypothetical protein
MPAKLEGIIFTEVLLPLVRPEIDSVELVGLGAIVKKKNRMSIYRPLTDALRKIQMVKLAGLRAKQVESQIEKEIGEHTLLQEPIGLIEHSLNVTDCMVHTKSALDSMAVFLTDLLDLGLSGGDRDFKKTQFRKAVEKDRVLGPYVQALASWFDNVQTIRDEWIHRSSLRSFLVIGKSAVGRLPVAKDVTLGSRAWSLQLSKENFMLTSEFVDSHYSKLVNLFMTIVRRSRELESTVTEPVSNQAELEKQMSLFPTVLSESMKVETVRVGSMTGRLFGGKDS